MIHNILKFNLSVILIFSIAGCGGGSGSSGGTSSGGAVNGGGVAYSLSATSVPISQGEKLVTVTVKHGTTQLTFIDRIRDFFLPAWNVIIPTAFATQISPTLSTLATAKIVSGQVTLVNPVFSTIVEEPDPTDATKKIKKTVSVTCDTSSIQTTVHVNSASALNYLTGDILVNMDYPKTVSATYDSQTSTFSACSFTYGNGFFIVYGDNSVSSMLDPTLGETPALAGCGVGYQVRVIAAGDPTRNPTSTPLLNSLMDTSYVDGTTGILSSGPLCGSVRALSYSKLNGQTFTKLNFSNDVLGNNTSFVADSTNVYAIGADRTYGGYATSSTCPISVTQIGSSGSSCITIPNVANYINYPASVSQLQAAGQYVGLVQKPYPSLFIGTTGTPVLSLQTYPGLCGLNFCLGLLSSPTLFSINPSQMTSSIMLTPALDASGYPWGTGLAQTPIGFSNGYLLFSMGGPGNGILVNINTGNVIHTCSNTLTGTDFGCSGSVSFGNYVYGYVGCNTNSSAPNVCLNQPTIDRTNTLTGVTEHWDLISKGYLLLGVMQNSSKTAQVPVRPIFDTNQVTFLACPSPDNTCAAPNWVSLDFTTGQITPITTGGITFDQLPTMIGTTLWN